ncbi:GSCOCG00006805001-RA-CDS [Cotesia congregata]|nr:GSCOCG00006805001-RA-CDS [Cotesia congregata]
MSNDSFPNWIICIFRFNNDRNLCSNHRRVQRGLFYVKSHVNIKLKSTSIFQRW